MEDEGQFQTRSYEGEIRTFNTFRQALDFADGIWKKVLKSTKETDTKLIIEKISFSIGKERVRLIWEEGNAQWALRQMEDDIKEELTARAGSHICASCGDSAVIWTPGGYCCAKCSDDGTSGATC